MLLDASTTCQHSASGVDRVLAHYGLKDRKRRTLSEDDIDHYRKIVAALAETRRLMAEIDEVIGKHGGWPEAFQTDEAPNTATMNTRKRGASGII